MCQTLHVYIWTVFKFLKDLDTIPVLLAVLSVSFQAAVILKPSPIAPKYMHKCNTTPTDISRVT